jgi:LPS sulfotransferase NodH
MPEQRCVPFVVLFTGRSGSTYLVESLDRHTDIRAEKEMFAAMRQQGCAAADQIAWARSFLATPPYEGCLAVGYKTKPRDIPDPDAFRALLTELGARVVLLQRRNVVKQAVSLINAMRLQERTGDWNLYSEGDRAGLQAIEPAEFEKYLRKIEQDQAAAEAYAATLDLPLLRIWYEDMLRDEAGFLGRIFEFLGAPFEAVRGSALKNTSDDLRASLANFDELRSRYEGTRYAEMFDENIVPAGPCNGPHASARGGQPAARGRIIVSGMAGLHPVGGMAWHYLQYVVGLQRMGFEVVYHEDTRSWPYHPLERRQTD